jgi:hypothetical protein
VIVRERELHQLSLAFASSSNTQTLSLKQDHHEQFNTYQEESGPNNDHSVRKRAKIFEPRPSSQVELVQHRESSKIMQETSTNDNTKQKVSKGSEAEPHVPLTSSAVQTANDNQLAIACIRLQSEQATVKFLRLWVKFSERANRGGQGHQKTMVLYRWRLNALFDEQARRKIEQALSWPRRVSLPNDYVPHAPRRRNSPFADASTTNSSSNTNADFSTEKRHSSDCRPSSRTETAANERQFYCPSKDFETTLG